MPPPFTAAAPENDCLYYLPCFVHGQKKLFFVKRINLHIKFGFSIFKFNRYIAALKKIFINVQNKV